MLKLWNRSLKFQIFVHFKLVMISKILTKSKRNKNDVWVHHAGGEKRGGIYNSIPQFTSGYFFGYSIFHFGILIRSFVEPFIFPYYFHLPFDVHCKISLKGCKYHRPEYSSRRIGDVGLTEVWLTGKMERWRTFVNSIVYISWNYIVIEWRTYDVTNGCRYPL